MSKDFEEIWKIKPNYAKFGLSRNPFSIHPLFYNYADEGKCKQDEKLFVVRKESKEIVAAFGLGRRIMVYGEVGVGKSSILNLLLYIARFRDRCFPIRVVIKEDNVDRAIQELLYTYCFEIIKELKHRKLTEPLKSIKLWLLKKGNVDKLYDFMRRLAGPYEEEITKESRIAREISGEVGTGLLPGGKVEGGLERETATISSFRTYVENLPVKSVEEYFKDLTNLVKQIGYKGTAFAIDEADHIRQIDKVLGMLTISREIFFLSKENIFVIAGSTELITKDKEKEIPGIFDATIHVKKLSPEEIKEALTKRIQAENESLKLTDVFAPESVNLILKHSGGTVKYAIKLAENALDEAAISKKDKVTPEHFAKAIRRARGTVALEFEENELKILKALSEIDEASPSDKVLQQKTGLSRQSLDRILRSLYERRYVERIEKGRVVRYRILPAYIPLLGAE